MGAHKQYRDHEPARAAEPASGVGIDRARAEVIDVLAGALFQRLLNERRAARERTTGRRRRKCQ